jgi:hypothetical protein
MLKQLLNIASDTAARRRQMTAEVLSLLVTKDAESVLTREEMEHAWREAVRQEWATENGDGTYSITAAGQRCVEAMQVAERTDL